jgi:hypothetical protein
MQSSHEVIDKDIDSVDRGPLGHCTQGKSDRSLFTLTCEVDLARSLQDPP